MRNLFSLAVSLLPFANAVLVKQNVNDPGTEVWVVFSGCPGQANPAGTITNVIAQWADPLWDYWTLPAKYTTSDGKHLNTVGQDYFCNASVWSGSHYYVKTLSGRWLFQSSLPWNLCGSGYATGPWKGESSLWIKTIESKGALGLTAFFVSYPTKWGHMPEMCAGITMPTTSSSYAQFLGSSKTVGYKLYLAAAYGMGSPTVTITAGEDLAKDRPVTNAAYAIAVVSALLCIATSIIAGLTLRRLKVVRSFAAVVLAYELVAGFVKAFLLLVFAPLTFGPTFYNGFNHWQDMVVMSMLPSVGHFSTILTSLVWFKFSFIRQDKLVYNIFIALFSFTLVVLSFFACTSYMNVFKREGILAGLAGAAEAAASFSYTFQIVLSIAILVIFLVSNIAWLVKLSKSATVSSEIARIARLCMKVMFAQIVLLALSILSAYSLLSSQTDPMLKATTTNVNAADMLLDATGASKLSLHAFCAMFLDPIVESLLGLTQVLAMRSLSSSSSSS